MTDGIVAQLLTRISSGHDRQWNRGQVQQLREKAKNQAQQQAN